MSRRADCTLRPRAHIPQLGEALSRGRHEGGARVQKAELLDRPARDELAHEAAAAGVEQEHVVRRHGGGDEIAARRYGDGANPSRGVADEPQPVGGQRLAEHGLRTRSRFEPRPRECEPDARVGVDRQLLERGRLECTGPRLARLGLRAAALRERPDGEARDDRERGEGEAGEREQAPVPAVRGRAFLLEPALLAPGADRLGEDIVEDLVPVRAVDAVDDPVARQRREHGAQRALRHAGVLREIVSVMCDLRPRRGHEMLEHARGNVLLVRSEPRERAEQMVAHDRSRPTERP